MKKNIKRTIATLVAAVTMTVGLGSMSVNAQSVTNFCSTGGRYGYMYYNLSTTGYSSHNGIDFYQLKATSKQTLPYGGSYLAISAIDYNACIYLKSGEVNESEKRFTTKDAEWYTLPIAQSAVVVATEKGYVTHKISSEYYGSITKTLKNY